jgi:ADP-ribose pyrophosphatase YjhB (NUDIX family)
MFNIRVYGILINDNNEILVSDEYIKGNYFTKFCGGGLEHKEGLIDCVKREFKEEMNLSIDVISHLYTTDFYQQSAFNKDHQLISIYYKVKALEAITVPLRDKPFHFDESQLELYKTTQQIESFRFIHLNEFSPDCMTFPIDKIVAGMLC